MPSISGTTLRFSAKPIPSAPPPQISSELGELSYLCLEHLRVLNQHADMLLALQARVSILENENTALASQNANLEQELHALKHGDNSDTARIATIESATRSLSSKLDTLDDQIGALHSDNIYHKSDIQEIIGRLNGVNFDTDDLLAD